MKFEKVLLFDKKGAQIKKLVRVAIGSDPNKRAKKSWAHQLPSLCFSK